MNPREVDANLAGIEASPPPVPPRPSLSTRLQTRIDQSRISARTALIGLVAVIALVIAAWFLIPRLGDLDNDSFEFRASLSVSITL